MRLLPLAPLAAALAAAVTLSGLEAQSSLFGARGLGLPGRPHTAATRATGGSFALFDGESDLNPAALTSLRAPSAGYVVAPGWRSWSGPAGDASLRETRFPLLAIGGPAGRSRVGLGVAIGSYADRDFRLTTTDTLLLRGVPVEVTDTLSSLGGLSEIRLAAAVALGPATSLGAAGYWITGSSRGSAHRVFGDTAYQPVRQRAELSYQGFGVGVGLLHSLGDRLRVAAFARTDTRARIEQDSTPVYRVDLPSTVALGVQARPAPGLTLAASAAYRTWSDADADLRAQGAPGARNTLELTFGGELVRNLRRPGSLPVRFGVRYQELPFPLEAGDRPREIGVSGGTGVRFAQGRAGVDLTLEQVWRSEGTAYRERAFGLIFGLTIRPYGPGR